jgi:hypothetical protein
MADRQIGGSMLLIRRGCRSDFSLDRQRLAETCRATQSPVLTRRFIDDYCRDRLFFGYGKITSVPDRFTSDPSLH